MGADLKHKQVAQEMLDALEAFMCGQYMTEKMLDLQEDVTKAACYAAAAYDAHLPKTGGEGYALARTFLVALIDPLSPELNYLRIEPEAGEEARQERRQKSH